MAKRKLPDHVDKWFKTRAEAMAYKRKVDKTGRVATLPRKFKGKWIVRSTRHSLKAPSLWSIRQAEKRAAAKRKAKRKASKPKKAKGKAKKGKKKARRNPGTKLSAADMQELMKDPEFKKALKLYRKLHGCDPESISRRVLPIGGKRVTGREFFVSMGKAPAESYEPHQKNSKKKGTIWVHPYDDKPEKVVSADGKTIITMPGSHAVRVIDGEAWIDG